jgi:hypothetical protein
MNSKFLAWALWGLTGLLYLLGIAAFVSMLQALLIPETVTAVESAFGSFVLVMMLFVLAHRTRQAARKKLQQATKIDVESDDKP